MARHVAPRRVQRQERNEPLERARAFNGDYEAARPGARCKEHGNMVGRNTVLCWMGDIGIRPDSDRFASVPTATSLALPSRPSGIVFFTCRPPPHTPRPSLPRLPPNTRPRSSRLPKLRPGAKRAGSAKLLKGLAAVFLRSTAGSAWRSPLPRRHGTTGRQVRTRRQGKKRLRHEPA